MFGYIVRRIIAAILVLIVTSMMVFALFFYGPSDPAQALCPSTRCSDSKLAQIRTDLGLDRPIQEQYLEYMKGIFVGREIASGAVKVDCSAPCLGVSFKFRVDVFDYLAGRFPASIGVAFGGAAVFLTVGLASGIFAARRRGTAADKGIVGASLFINAIPYYLLALLAYLYLISQWGVFPESGYVPITKDPFGFVKGMLLAWVVLGLAYSTQYARFSRGSMIDSLNEDYVRTARAKGLSDRKVVVRHAMRAAIVPVVTIFGLDFATLLAGTVFTEKIFNIQGIGLTALDAINRGDLPIISATVLLSAVFIVAANIVVDILYSVIDPRVRLT